MEIEKFMQWFRRHTNQQIDAMLEHSTSEVIDTVSEYDIISYLLEKVQELSKKSSRNDRIAEEVENDETNSLETRFFRAFGISPEKIPSWNPLETWDLYPDITDEDLLNLMCLTFKNSSVITFVSLTKEKLYEEVLEVLINNSFNTRLYEDVRNYFLEK